MVTALLFAAGCGGDDRDGQSENSRQTLAGIELKRPTQIPELLAWAEGHGIKLTEVVVEYEFRTETITSHVRVQPDATSDELEKEFASGMGGIDAPSELPGVSDKTLREQRKNVAEAKRRAAEGPALIDRIEVSGPADVLYGLEDDPLVGDIFVKP